MIFLSCYNLIKDTCSGACQGCSDCPVCNLYHNDIIRDATRWEIIKYAFGSQWEYFKMWLWFKMNYKKIKEIMGRHPLKGKS
jgi:hypothetical protein